MTKKKKKNTCKIQKNSKYASLVQLNATGKKHT